ncbi:hypothetical protein HNR46_003471 [Haloferula luteola]|uniref:Calx-beta domain-containing protein n=1 Tax=Haloferula luteola TaxID=595692 RepID=A0A840V837_9BACT|nr:Calx-beta domain-containing protein [Haloferula luteola]MBB5353216.1 hypothetical protein [Haloferula luteola]
MKTRPTLLWISGGLLVATTWIASTSLQPQPTESPEVSTAPPARQAINHTAARNLQALTKVTSTGHLWETTATHPREARRSSIPIRKDAFESLRNATQGNRISLSLARSIPTLRGVVTRMAVQDDGTRMMHLQLEGDPAGDLLIQENPEADFFLAQLYYPGEPIAYEFRPSGSDLIAERHAVSDLICSSIEDHGTTVAMGLPQLEIAEAKPGSTGGTSGGGKGGGTTDGSGGTSGGSGITISVGDATVSEGQSGTTYLIFPLTLSAKDRKNIITVQYATSDGSATSPSDYASTQGVATFAKNTASTSISVPVVGDTLLESDETLTLTLSQPAGASLGDATAVGTILNDDIEPSKIPLLHSLPGATAVAYLDFDGQTVSGTYWANGATITARGISETFSTGAMTEIWTRVVEDYAPFQINVTTDENVYLAAPSNRRIRCIVTPDNEWYGSAGGVAYVNSFTWTGDTPCWIFSDMLANSSRYIAEAASHEIGHTLGLRHDGRTNPVEGYYQGHGNGETGWAPIMGVGYYQSLTQWSKGEYLNADNPEDDLAIITGQNGFSYRSDDHGDTLTSATSLQSQGGTLTASGLLQTTADVDVFSFTVGATGTAEFLIEGAFPSTNLDLLAEIRDAQGNLVTSDNPSELTYAHPIANLGPGTYYLHVSGVGKGDPLANGYSDYGSLGSYTINGQTP